MVRYLFQVAMLVAASFYAWRRGGWPEKATAGVLATMFVLDPIYHAFVEGPQYLRVDWWHTSLDLTALAAMVALSLRAPRVWLLWVTSLQLVASLGHGLQAVETDLPKLVYWTMTVPPSYFQIVLLAIGTFLNDPRRRARLPT